MPRTFKETIEAMGNLILSLDAFVHEYDIPVSITVQMNQLKVALIVHRDRELKSQVTVKGINGSTKVPEHLICGEAVKTLDNTTRPCLRFKGHKGGHNPFSNQGQL